MQVKGTSQIFRIAWLGGARPEWTRLAANFEAISFQDVECDEWPSHLPWGKTLDYKDKGVYATSTQPEYPRKMCVALVQCVLRQLQRQGMTFFLRNSFEDTHGNQWFEKPSETCKGAAHHT